MKLARFGFGLIGTVAIIAAIALAVVRFTGAGTSGYLVRAVFDNSSFVIPGEQVKVAGVVVGTIHAIDLTPQNKAAVVLQITNRQFVPFRADAHCQIGLESLLGEQFVQCTPTQPRSPGTPAPAALPAIDSGPNQGQHLLAVQNTTTPVGLDLLNDIMRLPEQQRFQLIIAGLGAGLAGNGQELNVALRRADPALQQTDQVIGILASENRTLAQLTDDSARVLAPLAAQRGHIGGFIQHAGAVAQASAQEGQAIQANFHDFPAFLRQLKPYTQKLSDLADQMTPALQSLQAQAPAINASVHGLGPLADSSIPAFVSLGKLAHRGQSIFPSTHRLAKQLLALTKPLLPLATDIGAVAQSFDNSGGIEDVMRFIYYYAGSVNGEDSLGHYIRSLVQISCGTPRTNSEVGGCDAKFSGGTKLAARRESAASTTATAGGGTAIAGGRTTSGRSSANVNSSSGGASPTPAVSRVAMTAVRSAPAGSTSTVKSLLHYLLSP